MMGMDKQEFMDASYSQLQRISGVDRAVWSRYFNRETDPSLASLDAIAQKLGIDENDFIAWFRERRDRQVQQREDRE